MADARTNRKGWAVVAASALALIVGQGVITVFAAGVFLKPVAAEFALGRGVISSAIAFSNVMAAIGTPFFGRAIDLYGVRRPLLTSIVLFSFATAAMSLLQNSASSILLLYAVAGLFGCGNNPTAYSKVVMARFDRNRGLALGITLAGVGLGTAIMPLAAEWMIRYFGWRASYVGLGIGILGIAFLPALLLLHEPPVRAGGGATAHGSPSLPGMEFGRAVRNWRYLVMALVFTVAAIAINGSLIHVVPLLTDRGIPASRAVAAMSAAGLAMIGGRLFVGWLMDRIFAPLIGAFFLLCPLAGLLVLNSGAADAWPLIGTVLLGLGIGAEIDLMSFMISRYFGIRAFGALHGTMFTLVMLGNAIGAAALGWAFQASGSYTLAFTILAVLLFGAAGLLLTLGRYTYPAPRHGEDSIALSPAPTGLQRSRFSV